MGVRQPEWLCNPLSVHRHHAASLDNVPHPARDGGLLACSGIWFIITETMAADLSWELTEDWSARTAAARRAARERFLQLADGDPEACRQAA